MILLLVAALTLDPQITQLTKRFNDYAGRYRLVMLASPT